MKRKYLFTLFVLAIAISICGTATAEEQNEIPTPIQDNSIDDTPNTIPTTQTSTIQEIPSESKNQDNAQHIDDVSSPIKQKPNTDPNIQTNTETNPLSATDASNQDSNTANPLSTVNGTAQSTLNSGTGSGIANVSVKVDNQTVQIPVTVQTTFTITQIKQAASTVRNYIETYHKLPSTVDINGINVTMSQFLELLTTALLQINSGTNSTIPLMNFSAPTSPTENIKAGNIPKAEFLKIANDIKNYMDSSGKTPDFAYQTSLGTYLRFENLVYMYSMILDYHRTSGKMADFAMMEPWSVIISKPVLDPNAPKFTVEQIKDAASRVRAYIESSHKLPNYVQIGSNQVSMSQFLELLTTVLLQINSGTNSTIPLMNFSSPTSPIENIHAGNIPRAEFLKIANDIKNYMDSSGKTPDFAYQTSLGTFLRFENLVYMYSMILDYHHTSGKMADFATMMPWNLLGKDKVLGVTDYGTVEKLGPFGNINSTVKIAYIVGVHPLENISHQALIESIQKNNSLLKYCYYIYKVTVTKDASNYDKGRMNGQLLANKFAVPDIIKEKFNLAIDVHSNRGNWQYKRFVFSPVPGTSAESIARTVKNEMQWLIYYIPPNPTSTQYVTVPLIQGGIPAFVYEVYTYDSYSTVKNEANQLVMVIDNLIL